MTQGPDHPDENPAEATIGLFGTEAGVGDERGQTEAVSARPVEDRSASELTERDSTSQGVTAPSPRQGPAEDEQPPLSPSPSTAPEETLAGLVEPEPGKVLFGTYLVERKLGGGAMGTVWLVRNIELNKLRALKLIVPGIAFDPAAQARFRREAQVMALVEHPNAVTVHTARISRDVAYIEMEYVSGKSLDQVLERGVPMPPDWVARLLAQLCDALQEAHDKQVVHRDLKPSNMMLVDSLVPGKLQLKVLDFGIAKVLESDGSDVHTSTGQFMGTAQYTSPEQASGGHIDHRSDIYSVGVILYELLTGARPFTGPVHQLIFGHLYSTPTPFADRNPPVSVPPEVEAVVMRCLAKNPDDRPQSALAVAEAFSRAVFGVASPPEPQPENREASRGWTQSQEADRKPSRGWMQPAQKDLADEDRESTPTPTTFTITGKRSRRNWISLALLFIVAVIASVWLVRKVMSVEVVAPTHRRSSATTPDRPGPPSAR